MVALNAVIVRHERRVRLVFSSALAVGAFTSTSYYTVTSQDGLGASPGVQAVIQVPDSPAVAELQLDADLVQGGLYRFSAVAVPAADLSVTPDPSELDALFGQKAEPGAAATAPVAPEAEVVLYGRDLHWNSDDFEENAEGDLARLEGAPLVQRDLTARALSEGLPWDPTYGAKPRGYVDGAGASLRSLRSAVVAQTRADDRVSEASATLDLEADAGPTIAVKAKLVGGQTVAPITVQNLVS